MSEINLKAELNRLPIKRMNGQQKFIAVACIMISSSLEKEISVKEIQKNWKKSLLGIGYSYTYYDRSQTEDWVVPVSSATGIFTITSDGLRQFKSLQGIKDVNNKYRKNGSLVIFDKKSTHTFDKYVRGIVGNAKKEILIADSWVNEYTFDNILDSIPVTVNIKLIYANPVDKFDQRKKRFESEYTKFYSKQYKSLHDRFFIVDGQGYISGPSLKDAALKSPAILVELGKSESSLLRLFHQELWKK
ncbi:MAG: hypothetical protein A2458_00375 [Candidatus Kerfeldbacteria bacterium RIFOXYC2_FULL_38_9]|nr:MAG: hypothetical protein A2458_00375 [Candidatus Kerfeldbacteria bacterium RIFOXYC2_FULL_38_9]